MNFGNARSAPALALTPELVEWIRSPLFPGEGCTRPPPPAFEDRLGVASAWGWLALVAVLGLIPFWMWIYFVYNPPIR